MFCSGCGREIAADLVFCGECGQKLRETPEVPFRAGETPPRETLQLKMTGRLLQRVRASTRFEEQAGRTGPARVGTLMVYDNRIIFTPAEKLNFFSRGPAGDAALPDILPVSDIIRAETRPYMRGVYTALMLTMTDGRRIIFIPPLPSSGIMADIVRILAHFTPAAIRNDP